MDNTSTVQSIYAAFGRGDVPAILAHLQVRVAWEQWQDHSAQKAGVPWLAARNGPAEAVAFFAVLSTMKFRHFQVLSLMAGGNQVAAEIQFEAELAGGAILRDEEMHLWTFDGDGKVTRFRHYADTHKHMRAAGVA